MVEQRVSSGTASLAVTVWGDDGPTILALHPGVGDSRIWNWCAPAWADAGYRVIAHDRRGFGETQYQAEDHDDLIDLRAVTRATGATPAIVVGNSRGGGLALDLALEFPDEVSALVLIAPSPSGYDYDNWPTSTPEAEQDDLIAAADSAGDLDLVNRLEIRYWLDGVDQPDGRVGGAPRTLMAEMNGLALRAAPIGEAATRPEAWGRLAEIGVPTLVIMGEHDLPGIRNQCRELADAIPLGRSETITGSAHCPSLDQPEKLNTLVLGFLDTIAA